MTLLALLSNLAVSRMLFFLPLFILVLLQILYRIIVFILMDLNLISYPNLTVFFFDGFFEAPVQLYMFFLSPLRIADKYRFTQEVTPAATLISSMIVIAYMSA